MPRQTSKRRPRPYIPLSVRVEVAWRQLAATLPFLGTRDQWAYIPNGRLLPTLLRELFGEEPCHLDHNPALELRPYDPKTGRYTPDANDPQYLIYRTRQDHHIKTNVRGDGALRSDTAEAVHRRRLERNRAERAGERKPRFKKKIPQRPNPWPKGRKLLGRPFPKRK